MWWILQIVGCLGVTIAQIINRKLGIGIPSWIAYSLIAILVTYPTFCKSYAIAPSFSGAWFVGQTALTIVGLLAGFIVFHDAVSTLQWIGIGLSIVSGYLIIFGA
jgi:hypothetical protein